MIRKNGSTFRTTLIRKKILKSFCLFIAIMSMAGSPSARRTCSDILAEVKQQACTHPSNSCFMRCGTNFLEEFMSASTNKSDYCACDERCKVYADCCWDFHIQCQREFEMSVTKYSHLLHLSLECHRSLYTVITDCQTEMSTLRSTSPAVFETGFTLSSVNPRGTLFPTKGQQNIPVRNSLPNESASIKPNLTQYLAQEPAQAPTTKLYLLHREYMYVLDQTYGVVYKNETIYDCFKTPDSVKVILPRLLVVDYTRNKNMDIESRIDIDESLNLNVIDLPYRKCYGERTIMCVNPCKSRDYSFKTCQSASLDYNSVHTEFYSSNVCYPIQQFIGATSKPTKANELLGTTIGLHRVGNKDEAYLLIALKEFWKILYCSNPQLHLHECQVLQCADSYLPLDARTCFKPKQVEILVSGRERTNTNVSEKVENFKPALPCTCFLIYKAFQNVFSWRSNRLQSRNECTFTITHPVSTAFEEAEQEGVSILDILNRSVTISEINRSGIDRIHLKHLDTLSLLQNEIKLQFLSHNQCEDPYSLVHACFNIGENFSFATGSQHLRTTMFKEMMKANGENVKCFSFHRNQSNKIQSLSWLVIIIVLSVLKHAVGKV